MIQKGSDRVMRGGSWNNNGRNVRSAYRNHNSPDNRNQRNGFRLVLAHSCTGRTAHDQIKPCLFLLKVIF
ncbi:hypothetical protein KKHLCK_01690 [Candidatus Electrothrix laxa]